MQSLVFLFYLDVNQQSTMAPGFFSKLGQFFKKAIPKVVQAIPKVLDVAGGVVGKVFPTAGKVLSTIGRITQPIAKPASEGLNKVLNGSQAAPVQSIADSDINKAGEYADKGLQFMAPVLRRFKVGNGGANRVGRAKG